MREDAGRHPQGQAGRRAVQEHGGQSSGQIPAVDERAPSPIGGKSPERTCPPPRSRTLAPLPPPPCSLRPTPQPPEPTSAMRAASRPSTPQTSHLGPRPPTPPHTTFAAEATPALKSGRLRSREEHRPLRHESAARQRACPPSPPPATPFLTCPYRHIGGRRPACLVASLPR